MTRFQKIVIALLAVLVAAVIVVGVVIVQQQAAAAAQVQYLQCMAIHGSTPENPGTFDEAFAASEACD